VDSRLKDLGNDSREKARECKMAVLKSPTKEVILLYKVGVELKAKPEMKTINQPAN
jgi:hypothetical protein